MHSRRALFLLLALVILPVMSYAQTTCVAPALSGRQVKDIIDKERAARTDLPKAYPKYRWDVSRQGCHYVYVEYGLPEAPEYNHIFSLNQYGVIVDAQGGNEGEHLKCPDKVFTESELAEIIKKEREKRDDLPLPLPSYKTQVSRSRCLYFYYENALPETRGNYHAFIIDPFGELMEFHRAQPY